MTVYLTNTTKRHNSTLIPTEGRAITCMLKEGSSIISPILIFERSNVGHNYNYVYIPDFERRYFVDDIIYDGARIYYHCSVDVLASYKSTIGAYSGYVLRAAHTYNEYVIDQYYPITTRILQHRVMVDGGPWYEYGMGRGRWVVGVVNSDGVSYYCFTSSMYKRFIAYLTSDKFPADLGIDFSLNPSLRVAVDPMQYVTCCFWLPFTPTISDGSDRFPEGPVNVAKLTAVSDSQGAITAGDITAGSAGDTVHDYTLDILPHPQSSARGRYLNSPGFSECVFVYPPFGSFNLNPLELQQYDSLRAIIDVDCTTGIGKLRVYGYITSAGELPVATIAIAQAQIGVPIPVTQIITPGVSPVQIGMQTLSALGRAVSGDIGGAIAGGMSAIESYEAGKVPKSSVVGSRGSLAALSGYATIEYTWHYVADDNNADHGRPLCQIYQLSELPGFQMIHSPDVNTTGTAAEDDQINSFLASGYFYE